MNPRFIIPQIDFLWVVVFCLVQQQSTHDTASRQDEAGSHQVRMRREEVGEQKVALRISTDGACQLGDQHFSADDPQIVNALKRLHDNGALLHVLVTEGASARLVFRAMDLVAQAGFETPSMRPSNQR